MRNYFLLFLSLVLLFACDDDDEPCRISESQNGDYLELILDGERVDSLGRDGEGLWMVCDQFLFDSASLWNGLGVYWVEFNSSDNCSDCVYILSIENPFCEVEYTPQTGNFSLWNTDWDLAYVFQEGSVFYPRCNADFTYRYIYPDNYLEFYRYYFRTDTINFTMYLDGLVISDPNQTINQMGLIFDDKIEEFVFPQKQLGVPFHYNIQEDRMYWFDADSVQGMVFYAP